MGGLLVAAKTASKVKEFKVKARLKALSEAEYRGKVLANVPEAVGILHEDTISEWGADDREKFIGKHDPYHPTGEGEGVLYRRSSAADAWADAQESPLRRLLFVRDNTTASADSEG